MKTTRPLIQFPVRPDECIDYYQGFEEMRTYIALCWPRDLSELPTHDELGVAAIMRKYKKILVLSTGRGVFWSEVLKRVDGMIGAQQMEFLEYPPGSVAHGFWQAKGKGYSKLTACPNARCADHWLCQSCLRRIQRWAGFPDRKLCVYMHTVAVQTNVSSMAPQRRVPGSGSCERIDVFCASMIAVVAKKVREFCM